MASLSSAAAVSDLNPIADESLKLNLTGAKTTDKFGDFRDDLARDGYAVVKGAVPRELALATVEKIYQYLEDFNLGFKRDDSSTIKRSKLPYISEKGMIMHYGSAHESFVWDIRSSPGVISAFEKVFNTSDLIVSFDAINVSFHDRSDWPENKPWPHQDQDPATPEFRCLQGLVNLQPSGPDDGGLIVCKGGHLLSEEFHIAFKDEVQIPRWTNEWYGFTDAGMKWLADKGCVWEKVCAEPGDLLVWDSRTPHYNKSPEPTSTVDRMAVYTCYMPVEQASQEDLRRKKDAWDRKVGTSHWPNARVVGSNGAWRGEDLNGVDRQWPISMPLLSERAFKLTGVPYIKAEA